MIPSSTLNHNDWCEILSDILNEEKAVYCDRSKTDNAVSNPAAGPQSGHSEIWNNLGG